MPVSCVAYGCSNRFKKNDPTHFFRFPINNEVLLNKWINALKKKNFVPKTWSRICSMHFTENDYQIRPGASRPLLKTNAVPSIFPAFPEYYQQKAKKLRNPPQQRNSSTSTDELTTTDNNFNQDDLSRSLKCREYARG